MTQKPQPETLTVSELTARIRQVLEQGFADVRILGEVSRLKRQTSGHMYFTIKDEGAAISAIIWRSTAMRLASPPEEGLQYIFSGHLSLYPPQGRYQLIVSRLEAAGGGALAAEFERRKALFAQRGWFDPSAKRAVPPLPRHIGIVTSASAAALQDVKKVLASRPGWLKLTLSPSLVQGAAAATQIVCAIRRLQSMPARPDVILLVRGGGSPEDLWCFNEETVVRAIVECDIPVITGIGHEIDISLADFAADLQAATPSNAAELACPDREALRRHLPRLALLRQLLEQMLAHAEKKADHLRVQLAHAWQLDRDERRMHVERLGNRLHTGSARTMDTLRRQLHNLTMRVQRHEPHHALRSRQRRLDRARQSIRLFPQTMLHGARQRLTTQKSRLFALSPMAVLERGYSMARMPDGRMVISASMLHAGDALAVHFHDGHADTRVKAVHPGRP